MVGALINNCRNEEIAMDIKFDLTELEIRDIALKKNKTVEEVTQDYKYALKDLDYSIKKINSIIDRYDYCKTLDNISIGSYGRSGELTDKYICHDKLDEVSGLNPQDLAIVTGFGPTSAPTAGTLASIFKAIELQKETGIYTHIIISELSALNSRQKPLNELLIYTYQFINFIKKLGFDGNNGEIRTHNFVDHSRTFSLISSVLKTDDFIEGEAMDETYKRLEVLGNDYSTMVSQAYTVADIVLPIIRDKKKGVIVPAGIEEHLYPYLARVVIERIKCKDGGLSQLINPDARVAAIYGKLIGGLFPYVKMSKSIKDSSINLGDTDEEIQNKIVNCGDRNENVVLQMMTLASNWSHEEIVEANCAFKNRKSNNVNWNQFKTRYFAFFIEIKKLWDRSAYSGEIDPYESLFQRKVKI